MAVHVPVTQKAKDEALDMLPSKNLFRLGHGDFMYMPSMEQIMGIYLLTKNPRGTKVIKEFTTKAEALRDYQESKKKRKGWSAQKPIKVANKRTTVGKILVNQILPKDWKEFKKPIDEDYLEKMFNSLKESDMEKKEITKIADRLKDLGNEYCYKSGFTVGLSDIDIDRKKKDQIYDKFKKKIEGEDDPAKIHEIFSEAEEQVVEEIKKDNPDNAFVMMRESGAKGGDDNLRSILAGPGLLTDNKGQVVRTPVTKSYAEGVDSADYWTSMYGARKGMIDRAKSTSEPGAFTKELINNTLDLIITERDCGTKEYIRKEVNNPNIHNRVLAKSVGSAKKGDVLKHKTIKELKKMNIEQVRVRSPLKCEAADGVCAKCYGHHEDGTFPSKGENIGVMAGHSLTEPSTQMTMDSFHSGGVASNEMGKAEGLDRLNQILRMPDTLKGKATLAKLSGQVTEIRNTATGGKEVFINDKKHFVPAKRKLNVKRGDFITRGNPICQGVIKQQELLETKGLDEVRSYMTNELYDTYNGRVDEKTIETVVQKVTNLTKVEDPGDSDFTHGQYAPLNRVNSFNKKESVSKRIQNAEGKRLAQKTKGMETGTLLTRDKIRKLERKGVQRVQVKPNTINHQPELKGINQLPLTNEDWIAKMNFNNIPKQFLESASTAAKSKYKDTTSPIPAYVHGEEFGGEFY